MSVQEQALKTLYADGYSAGLSEAEWALFEDRRNYSSREQALRDEASSYTAPSEAARRLRAFALGHVRGYRHGVWEVL